MSVSARERPSLLVGCGVGGRRGPLHLAGVPTGRRWPLAFVGLVPLLLVLRSCSAGRGALVGLCFGLGLYGASLYWIALFGELAWTALVLLCRPRRSRLFGAVAVLVRRPDRPIVERARVAAAWTVL